MDPGTIAELVKAGGLALMPMGGDDDSQANQMIGSAFFGQGTPAPMLRRG